MGRATCRKLGWAVLGAAFLGLLFGGTRAEAQITFDGCVDIRGVPVASVLDHSVQDVAMASLAPDGTPIIRYNPGVLAWFKPETRLFWYGHECGHHARGHNFGTTHPLAAEQDADCFAIRELIHLGVLSRRDLRGIQEDLARTGPGDWTHLPGPVRAVNLERCLEEGGDRGRRGRECEHPRHPRGDLSPCTHTAHPRGDVGPCEHACAGPWGPVACHPAGDLWPCRHPLHPRGDLSPCAHPQHPAGH